MLATIATDERQSAASRLLQRVGCSGRQAASYNGLVGASLLATRAAFAAPGAAENRAATKAEHSDAFAGSSPIPVVPVRCDAGCMDAVAHQHPGHQALRKGRVSVPGQIYLLTTICRGRCARFADFDAACAVARVLASPDSAADARLLAWVLMPDHWHGLLQLGDDSLACVTRRLNSLTARACNATVGSRGAVWSGAFHDRALRREEDLHACAWYLACNPVRAGLVAHPGDYPFWDAAWL